MPLMHQPNLSIVAVEIHKHGPEVYSKSFSCTTLFYAGIFHRRVAKQTKTLPPTPYVDTRGNKNQLFLACARPNVTNKSGLQREVDPQRSDFHLKTCKPMWPSDLRDNSVVRHLMVAQQVKKCGRIESRQRKLYATLTNDLWRVK
jgi:tRNA G26 N,N-dimethylase Trm1